MKSPVHISLFVLALCAYGTGMYGQQQYTVKPVYLGTSQSNYGTTYYEDGMIFCSNRKRDVVNSYWDKRTKHLLTDLYYATLGDSGSLGKAQLFAPELTTPYNEGPICFSPDGQRVYFTRNLYVTRKVVRKLLPENMVGIFTAELVDGQWTDIKPFPFNGSAYNVAHPSLSTDGNTIYFASDMQEGQGGTDLYFCKWVNGKWTMPQNLDTVINTLGNEVFPYMHANGTLYFASTGHDDGGDLDIYSTRQTENGWSTPVKLAAPINSDANDYGFAPNPSGISGYFTSDRNGTDNLFAFEEGSPLFLEPDTNRMPTYCYGFFEVQTRAFDSDSIPFVYRWDFSDGTSKEGLETDHCFPGPGTYEVQLTVIDTLTDTTFTKGAYELLVEQEEMVYIASPNKGMAAVTVSFSSAQSHSNAPSPPEYYWDFGDGSLAKGMDVAHVYQEPGRYWVKLTGVIKDPETGEQATTGCVFKTIEIHETTTTMKGGSK